MQQLPSNLKWIDTLIVLLAMLVGGPQGFADEESNIGYMAALCGEWELRIDGGGEIYRATIELEQGDSPARPISGVLKADGRKAKIESIRLEDGVYFLKAKTRRSGMPVVVALAVELVGNRLVGDIDYDAGTSVRSYPVEATRVGHIEAVGEPIEVEKMAKSNSADDPQSKAADVDPPAHRHVTFRQGFAGYSSAVDTEIWAIAPNTPLDRQGTMTTDGNNGGGESQVLIRFDDLIGSGEKRVPKNCRVVSAKLTIVAFDPGSTVYLHRVLVPWTAAATWGRMASGVTIDNIEASTVRDGFTFGEINMDKQLVEFDVTATVQKWASGEPNYGWVFVSTGGNGWDFYSSDWVEAEARPLLEVTFKPVRDDTPSSQVPQGLARKAPPKLNTK